MVQISFKDIKIALLSGSSGVFSGTNTQLNWKHVKKINEAQSSISGDKNTLKNSVHLVNDKDMTDY